MINGVGQDVNRLRLIGREAVVDFAALSSSHAALLEIELRDQLRNLVGVIVIAALAIVTFGIAVTLGSFALAGAITEAWPRLSMHSSLAIVAIANVVLMLLLASFANERFHKLSLLSLDSIKSYKESILCLARKF